MFPRWWQRQVRSRSHSSGRNRPARHIRLNLDALEERMLLSFAAPAAFDLPAAPQAVATGHFEGKAAPPDVVTADANGTVSVLLGKPDGTLQVPINLHVGGAVNSVAVGDLLGNGRDDVVTGNTNGSVNVLLSNGNGTFAAPRAFSVGATPLAVALGDFLGHGRLDVVTANTNGTVSVLPDNGNGTFGAPITTQVGGHLTSLAVGDVNRDGKPDLVVGNNTGVSVLLGTGAGTFQAGQTVPIVINIGGGFLITVGARHVALADFRGNGKLDVLADGRLLLGNGDGTFGSPGGSMFGGQTVASTVIGDFTGDGKLDIVTSDFPPPSFGGPSISLLAGNGDGTFAPAVTIPFGETALLAAADFNGDGKLDLALAGATTVGVLLNTGGSFATTPSVPLGDVFPIAIASGAFTRGGKPDLVTADNFGDAIVELNNGDGTFSVGPTLPTPFDSPTSVVVGDFNRDGNLDVALGTSGGQVDVFPGNGDGTFGDPQVFDLGSNNSIQSLVAGDFNRDGKLDLAVASTLFSGQTQTGLVTILLGNGDGTFRRGAATTLALDAQGLAAADLNGDGKLDLVTTTWLPDGTRNVEVLLGNGNGTFGRPTAVLTGTRATSVATGDFNGDGKPDLAVVDGFNNRVFILPGMGNGTFGSAISFQFNNPVLGLGGPAVGDFFGTGKLSLALTTGLSTVSVLQGNGDGTFQAPVNYVAGFHGVTADVVAGDFNGDGRLDLASTNAVSGDVSVLLNTTPPVHVTPPVATVTSLAADTTSAVFGQPVTLTATVASSHGTPTGTVTFLDGTTVLGRVAVDPNGQAILTVTRGVGGHAFRASFAGTGAFAASASAVLSATVNKAATTSTLSADTLHSPAFVLITATVAPVAPGAGVPTGRVTIFDGSTVLGTGTLDANGQFAVALEAVKPGHHHLSVVYGGDGNFDGSTGTLDVTF
jgi:hypothetical protein